MTAVLVKLISLLLEDKYMKEKQYKFLAALSKNRLISAKTNKKHCHNVLIE
jgi:hypothetical protein